MQLDRTLFIVIVASSSVFGACLICLSFYCRRTRIAANQGTERIPDLFGSIWYWADDGANVNYRIELLADGKVRVDQVKWFSDGTVRFYDGVPQGRWSIVKWDPRFLDVVFFDVRHRLRLEDARQRAVLEKPSRSRPSEMWLKVMFGSTWYWADDSINVNGRLELLDNGKVRWDELTEDFKGQIRLDDCQLLMNDRVQWHRGDANGSWKFVSGDSKREHHFYIQVSDRAYRLDLEDGGQCAMLENCEQNPAPRMWRKAWRNMLPLSEGPSSGQRSYPAFHQGFLTVPSAIVMLRCIWLWADDGANANGQVEFLEDGRIKWNLPQPLHSGTIQWYDGAPQGSWKFADGDNSRLDVEMFNSFHRLRLEDEGHRAVLEEPLRNPQPQMWRDMNIRGPDYYSSWWSRASPAQILKAPTVSTRAPDWSNNNQHSGASAQIQAGLQKPDNSSNHRVVYVTPQSNQRSDMRSAQHSALRNAQQFDVPRFGPSVHNAFSAYSGLTS